MKVLIFGIGGFVGPYLAKEFIDNGYQVIGADKSCNHQMECPLAKIDLLDKNDVEKLILNESPDIIINLAAISSVGQSWRNPQLTISVNVIGAINILEAANKLLNKPKVLLIGSSEEYISTSEPINEETTLNANNPYGISKLALEQFVTLYRDNYKLPVFYVRPFNHTGVGQSASFVLPSFCKQVATIQKSQKPGIVRVGNLNVSRDFSDVRDVAKAYRLIVENGDFNQIYNIGSGYSYLLRDLLNYIISLSDQNIEVIVDLDKYRPNDNPYICCDNNKLKEDLGWLPQYRIQETLKEIYNYYINNDVSD